MRKINSRACFVLAHRFNAAGQRGWAVYSRLTGVASVAGFTGMAWGRRTRPVPAGRA
jgi:hypothetical protein